MNLVMLEWRKMRRLRVGLILAAMVGVVVLFSLSSTLSSWPGVMLSVGTVSALVSPVFLAVLASRQTDMEHTGAGWTAYAAVGVGRGQMSRAKILALAPFIVLAVLVQLGLVMWQAGLGPVTEVGLWVYFVVGLVVTNLVLLSAHVLLSAVADNQLISIGIGALGSFAAVVSLLFPPWAAMLHPWGYYALSTPTEFTDGAIVYSTPHWGLLAGFTLASTLILFIALVRVHRTQEA